MKAVACSDEPSENYCLNVLVFCPATLKFWVKSNILEKVTAREAYHQPNAVFILFAYGLKQ